jgi:hypothetical protein
MLNTQKCKNKLNRVIKLGDIGEKRKPSCLTPDSHTSCKSRKSFVSKNHSPVD